MAVTFIVRKALDRPVGLLVDETADILGLYIPLYGGRGYTITETHGRALESLYCNLRYNGQ